jgi:serine/threonine-protein kinase
MGIGIWFLIQSQKVEEFSLYPYQNFAEGFQIKFPKKWERRDVNNPITGEMVEFLSPKEGPEDTFQEKVTISVEGFVGSLDEFSQLSTTEINNFLKQAQLESKNNFSLAQRDGKKFVFSGRVGNKFLKNVQVFTLKEGKAYVIVYTSQKDSFERFLPTAEAMVQSFKFITPETPAATP